MKIQISYYDPRVTELPVINNQNMTVIANNSEEYEAHIAALTNPERGITNITEEQLPDEPQLKYTDKEIRDYNETMLELTGYIPDSEVAQ